jgi:hypothetical protein
MKIAAGVNPLKSSENNPFQTKIICFPIQASFKGEEKPVAYKLKSV